MPTGKLRKPRSLKGAIKMIMDQEKIIRHLEMTIAGVMGPVSYSPSGEIQVDVSERRSPSSPDHGLLLRLARLEGYQDRVREQDEAKITAKARIVEAEARRANTNF